MTPGFLLTRQWTDDGDGLRLDFWLATAQGPLSVSIHGQQALFFIRQSEREKAHELLADLPGVSNRLLELRTFTLEPVCAFYFRSQQHLYRARDRLTAAGIACYEADIRPTERFLCERFITASIDVDADYSDAALHDVRLQPGEFKPHLEVMSLDIESDFETDRLFSIAFVANRQRRAIVIGEGADTDSTEYVADEDALLARWIEWVEEIDPDVFIGWNVINFDLRLLQKRCRTLGRPLAIGRGGAPPIWRQSQQDSNQHFVLVPGRVVLDGIDTLRSATYNFASFALEAVARELLGRGKLIHDASQTDPLFKAREIRRQFHEDKPALAAYNL